MLDLKNKYDRIDNIIYENNVPVIQLLQNFINLYDLKDNVISYMNRYMDMFPDLYKTLKPENNMKIVKVFIDLETTGVFVQKNGIHQIAGCIEIDDKVVENFNFKVRPNPKAIINPDALAVSNVTEEQVLAYPEMGIVYNQFLAMLSKYCDRYNAKDKMWLVGYNNRSFDDIFLRAWFEQNGDSYFGSWFWSDSLDVMILASQYLIQRRRSMSSFKLKGVAKELGIIVDETKLHDASYDIYLTREIYRVVTGLNLEPNDELF